MWKRKVVLWIVGFGLGSSWSFNAKTTSEGIVDKLADPAVVNCEVEIEKIRREFEDAKKNFLNIPATLKNMPKMNPEGEVYMCTIWMCLYF